MRRSRSGPGIPSTRGGAASLGGSGASGSSLINVLVVAIILGVCGGVPLSSNWSYESLDVPWFACCVQYASYPSEWGGGPWACVVCQTHNLYVFALYGRMPDLALVSDEGWNALELEPVAYKDLPTQCRMRRCCYVTFNTYKLWQSDINLGFVAVRRQCSYFNVSSLSLRRVQTKNFKILDELQLLWTKKHTIWPVSRRFINADISLVTFPWSLCAHEKRSANLCNPDVVSASCFSSGSKKIFLFVFTANKASQGQSWFYCRKLSCLMSILRNWLSESDNESWCWKVCCNNNHT